MTSGRILLVEDVQGMREALFEHLTAVGYEVITASNGLEAKDFLTTSAFDLVLSDVQMPGLDGVKLLEWIKKNKPTPVILMTGFSDILETQRAFEMGADDFLPKPFRDVEVLQAIERTLKSGRSERTNDEWSEERFCRIPIEDFVSGTGLNVGVYVRLAHDKFVKVAHQGDRLPKEKVDSYKKRGLNYLYVQNEDLASVVGFNIGLMRAVANQVAIPAAKKANFLRYTTETVLEQVYVNGIDKKSFVLARGNVEMSIALISESDALIDLLDVLNQHANWIYAHSLGVSLYSAMIGRNMGWTTPTNLFKLSLAGLLHDVGKKEIETRLLETPRSQLNREERARYETHPIRSKEILSVFDGLPVDVLHVALEHHENHLGGGFPRAVPNSRIHPFAKVVNVADRFCYHAMKSPLSPGHDAKAAFAHMSLFESDFDPAVMSAFKKCLEH